MKLSKLLAAIGLTVALSGGASAATIGGIEFPDGAASFADSVFSYTPGSGFSGSAPCQNSANALGVPDFSSSGPDCNGYVSLGQGGTLILQFTDNALTTSGNSDADLHIFEIGPAVEAMMISISTNATDWIDLGTLSGQPTSIDIDGVAGVVTGTAYSYVRIIDDASSGPGAGVFSGADIDAVGAISSTEAPPAVPLPASGVLLLGAFGAFAAAKRRKRSG